MARAIELLNDVRIRKLARAGRYPDGDGLYLQVTKSGGKSWLYRYKRKGKDYWKGLGTYAHNKTTLALARERATECRRLRGEGIDPIQHFKGLGRQQDIDELKGKSFKEVAEDHINAKKMEWSNAKHEYQWTQSLEHYVFPMIGHLAVEDIDTRLIEKVLTPIWHTKTETATRVRQRVEAILNRATTLKYRVGPNPAVWRGNMENLLPEPKKIREIVHQASMEYDQITKYYKSLIDNNSASALALRLLILSCLRSKEVRGAHIDEFDLTKRIWTIPASRMKGTKGRRYKHVVPLTDEMINVLNQTESNRRGGYIFPGTGDTPGVSDTAVRKQLHRTHPELTVHGFRSTFRTWAGESRNFASEVCEMCLAHKIESTIAQTYNHTDYVEKRRVVMGSWSEYCLYGDKKADVVPINKAAN
jgi:integrase